MIEIPTDLPADLVPLSWLVGVWEGTGVIDYEADGRTFSGEFAHRVSFSHDGGAFLNYSADAWLLEGDERRPSSPRSATGDWRGPSATPTPVPLCCRRRRPPSSAPPTTSRRFATPTAASTSR